MTNNIILINDDDYTWTCKHSYEEMPSVNSEHWMSLNPLFEDEVWKRTDSIGVEHYAVSNYGRVARIGYTEHRLGRNQCSTFDIDATIETRILRLNSPSSNLTAKTVSFIDNNKHMNSYCVYKLVAILFLNAPKECISRKYIQHKIYHISDNIKDDRASNIKIVEKEIKKKKLTNSLYKLSVQDMQNNIIQHYKDENIKIINVELIGNYKGYKTIFKITDENKNQKQSIYRNLMSTKCLVSINDRSENRKQFIIDRLNELGYKFDGTVNGSDILLSHDKFYVIVGPGKRYITTYQTQLRYNFSFKSCRRDIPYLIEYIRQIQKERDIEIISDTSKNTIITSYITFKCNKCGKVWSINIRDFEKNYAHHKNAHQCPQCSEKKYGAEEEYIIKELMRKYPEYDFSEAEFKGMNKKITIICHKKNYRGIEHGKFYKCPGDLLGTNPHGCPHCNQSKRERRVSAFLKLNNIEYIPYYRTDFLGMKSLDFYLTDYNLGIECQGEQHFEEILSIWKDTGIAKRDKEKYEQCKAHGIKILYFDDVTKYTEFLGERVIKNMDELAKVLNITNAITNIDDYELPPIDYENEKEDIREECWNLYKKYKYSCTVWRDNAENHHEIHMLYLANKYKLITEFIEKHRSEVFDEWYKCAEDCDFNITLFAKRYPEMYTKGSAVRGIAVGWNKKYLHEFETVDVFDSSERRIYTFKTYEDLYSVTNLKRLTVKRLITKKEFINGYRFDYGTSKTPSIEDEEVLNEIK